ncbi:DNA-directed RNA polymerase specialized sigma24 family protein [Dysgonomonas sp. PFB1-18]|uniref:hypothetical protein n=1 Tax=unclassified Dysgonomonas TaxID=2630389 RepID=UPI0024740A02|nr:MULTISPECIES: hypothetical protein [unclassified Dysgonomonas]MDH6309323.1 DNA-directed RNA polymerase specialized sigma24 family protein [Dysgonomonas sp. PF1-14]MDH6339812.1 DNA-directed RNA polymerase specialized sigma24 family protein [Dysgonomonas sp. PF1-16]MDH6381460.1 DNA-directed RNA polymerase specialized sigma24 family protein [Dysgonomonas sp. PFB1-18]MDH6398675.1 DNA-directed RNA polymerase specialized sigma24 family protein [Dysgonomonas sp. PF1-23]
MRLGNSNGNNKGKKYLKRGKGNMPEPKPAHRKMAQQFNDWFEEGMQEIINYLVYKEAYNEDVFNETYIRIYEKILYAGLSIKDYKAYYYRSYYTNYIQNKIAEDRYVSMPPFANLEAHHGNPHERERQQLMLENEVFDYVHRYYDRHEFELFKMYISLKPAVNYHTLAEITHIQAHSIQRIVSKILKDLRSNQKLVNKYKEVR